MKQFSFLETVPMITEKVAFSFFFFQLLGKLIPPSQFGSLLRLRQIKAIQEKLFQGCIF